MTLKRKPTSYHVAQLAGVSRTTVSFVLNNREDVAIPQKTRDLVLAAAKQLGYRPNRAASALASGTTNYFSLWLTSLSSVMYLNWIQHMQLEVTSKGYDLVFSERGQGRESMHEPRTTSEWPADGIFAYAIQWLPDYLHAHPLHTPVVLMGHYYSEYLNRYDYVGLDLYTPSLECMNYLISSGRKNIVYFKGPYSPTIRPPRFQAYEKAMSEAGLETRTLTSPANTRVSAYEWLKAYVGDAGLPDALFCANDDFAVAALRVAKDIGVRVPDDMAIAGCDGLEETAYHDPRLTTIELPYTEMCRTAWKYMERRIANPTAEPKHSIAKARLILRDSTTNTSAK